MKRISLFILPLLVLLYLSGIASHTALAVDLPTATPTATPLGDNDVIPLLSQGTLHLFALMGQSNMVGVDIVPTAQPTSPSIFRFRNSYVWRVAKEPIDDGGYVDTVSEDTYSGYSMAMSFALKLQELRGPEYNIGLIPCAKGGTKIAEWQRSLSDQTLYGSCLKRIRAASNMGQLDGVIFYQGEQDANESARYRSEHWDTDFLNIVDNLRIDTNNPNLAFGVVEIENLPNPPYGFTPVIQEQQENISYYNIVVVSAIGLPKLSDDIHLTWQSQHQLGQNMGDAMNTILP